MSCSESAPGKIWTPDKQIIDHAFARGALKAWFQTAGNVRQMHGDKLLPAGRAIALEERPDGMYLRSKVVEPGAVLLVDEGVYTSYSVKIEDARIVKDSVASNGRIVGGVFTEVSLVDYPANPTCKFSVEKRGARDPLHAYLQDIYRNDPDPVRRINAFNAMWSMDAA